MPNRFAVLASRCQVALLIAGLCVGCQRPPDRAARADTSSVAASDSSGVSSVEFPPGRTAIPQTVVAEVARVGRIGVRVSVPAASIRLVADERTLWSGDEVSVRAELRDAGGAVLAGGPLVWGTTDSTVLGVTSSELIRARVHGKLAGDADVVAWIEPGTIRAHARLTVKPVLSGAFVTIDGSAVPAMRMEVRSGAMRDSVAVAESRFVKRVELPSYQDVELRAVPSADAAFHPVHLRLTTSRALQDVTIALVPTSWRIDGGTYNGRAIPIDATGALRRMRGTAAFWRLAPLSRAPPGQLIGWPETAFPLRIAFNRRRSREGIAPDDSVAFWMIAERMQRDLDAHFFVPAELRTDSVPAGIVAVEIGTATMGSDIVEGHTFVTWTEAGDAYDGVLMFRAASTLRSSHVVTHELLHLLGFGHSSSFRSVSQAVSGIEQRLTPEDVAYAQLAMRLRNLQRQTGARPGLPVANQ